MSQNWRRNQNQPNNQSGNNNNNVIRSTNFADHKLLIFSFQWDCSIQLHCSMFNWNELVCNWIMCNNDSMDWITSCSCIALHCIAIYSWINSHQHYYCTATTVLIRSPITKTIEMVIYAWNKIDQIVPMKHCESNDLTRQH